jgi:L-threonylcarbamoyladenylate synthase
MPTETVYGLGANANDPAAVARIYEVKNRPANHPLIVHVSSAEAAVKWAGEIPSYVQALVSRFWPGPMSLVFERSSLAKDFVTGGQSTVAVRVPAHPIALELLKHFEQLGGLGVAAPSANRFGKISPTRADAVRQELSAFLGDNDVVLDGGDSRVGIESTIIDCTAELPRVLRLGAITGSMIEQATGLSLAVEGGHIRVSGSHASHYAPQARVLLDVEAKPGDGFIALDKHPTPPGAIRLAQPRNSEEFAHVLYSSLRKADELELATVVAITPHGDEVSEAIVDRLRRASTR